jgi:hypothetical protein
MVRQLPDQGWVASRESFPNMEPTPSAAGVHPFVVGDFLRSTS